MNNDRIVEFDLFFLIQKPGTVIKHAIGGTARPTIVDRLRVEQQINQVLCDT